MEERTARRGRQELRFETKRIVVPIRKDSNGGVSEKEPGISCVSSCPFLGQSVSDAGCSAKTQPREIATASGAAIVG
jgi:hypothetical protein